VGGAYVPTLFVGMYAPQGYNFRVSELKRYHGLNHLHYLTTGTYRRARLFDSEQFKKQWVATFGELREESSYLHNNPVKRGVVKHPGDWP